MLALYCGTTAAQDSAPWTDLTKGINTQNAAVAGRWTASGGTLSVAAERSARLTLPFQPKTEYDFQIEFTRTSGVHSIALMFVTESGQATFEVDAWGQHLAGIQMINGQTMQQNATRAEGYTLQNGRRYTATVQVRKGSVRALLDGKVVAEQKTVGSRLSVPDVWQMPDTASLGIGAYEAATTFHKVQMRPVSGGMPLLIAATSTAGNRNTNRRPSTASGRPNAGAASSNSATTSDMRRAPARPPGSSGKRVLLVIANQDFFYREYHDPREELERAGIAVDVAAGRRQTCRPHSNSGQQGSGHVMPDLAIADADASRYDAIMFSGGWGSSMYQYAFRGSYANAAYNGDRRTKEAVNRLLTQFIQQDKYVGALCHGVSVLAWARVNGNSILNGKRAVGSPRQSPAGIYNGRRDQPLSRWNAEVNGARLSPARSMGDPRTSADDVAVDGKIVTGEDDNSARLFGQTLARLLTQKD